MNPTPPLSAALERCYEVFSAYPPPLTIEASPLRDSQELLRTLTKVSLRDLSAEDIGPYAGYALTTVGGVADYKHFLPRILQQAVERNHWMGTEPGVIAGKLEMANWRDWPNMEQDAVRALFHAAWQQALGEHPDETDSSQWLRGLAALSEDMDSLLGEWTRLSSANAALQLAELVRSCHHVFEKNDEGVFKAAMRRWLLSGVPTAFLIEMCSIVDDTDQWRLDAAVTELEALPG